MHTYTHTNRCEADDAVKLVNAQRMLGFIHTYIHTYTNRFVAGDAVILVSICMHTYIHT